MLTRGHSTGTNCLCPESALSVGTLRAPHCRASGTCLVHFGPARVRLKYVIAAEASQVPVNILVVVVMMMLMIIFGPQLIVLALYSGSLLVGLRESI